MRTGLDGGRVRASFGTGRNAATGRQLHHHDVDGGVGVLPIWETWTRSRCHRIRRLFGLHHRPIFVLSRPGGVDGPDNRDRKTERALHARIALGNYVILDCNGLHGVSYVELYRDALFIRESAKVEAYRAAAHQTSEAALTPKETREFIGRLRKEL